MADYEKYIGSTGTHWISNSGQDERGQYTGGKAGDQSGKEWALCRWYSRPWTVVLRYPDPNVGRKIAELGIAAALNDRIGYDQSQRGTYWTQLQAAGFDPSRITVACEEDCTAGVTANVKAAGYLLGIKSLAEIGSGTSSRNMRSRFVAAGFIALTDAKYLKGCDYLMPGDILLYESHHAATNVTRGKYAKGGASDIFDSDRAVSAEGGNSIANSEGLGEAAWAATPANPMAPGKSLTLGDRILRNGMAGADVKELQNALIGLGYSCGSYGADGDFGDATEMAVRAFQREHGCELDGEAGPQTVAAIRAAQAAEPDCERTVQIVGGNCWARTANSKAATKLGVAYEGEKYQYGGETAANGWLLIDFHGQNAWVSGMYGRIVG